MPPQWIHTHPASYLLWYFLNFLVRQDFTYCSSERSVDGFSTSKSISISSGLASHILGSKVWMMCTTRPSLVPGSLLMSRLSWCFSSYVIGSDLSFGCGALCCTDGCLKFEAEQSKRAVFKLRQGSSLMQNLLPGIWLGAAFMFHALLFLALFFLLLCFRCRSLWESVELLMNSLKLVSDQQKWGKCDVGQ